MKKANTYQVALRTKNSTPEIASKKVFAASIAQEISLRLVEAVHEWPQFPGGGDAFMKYLDKTGKDMLEYLPVNIKKAYVQVEFIVDKDGIPTNFKILRGIEDDDFTDELITRLEKMPEWKPAVLHDKPVAKKMVQTVTVGID